MSNDPKPVLGLLLLQLIALVALLAWWVHLSPGQRFVRLATIGREEQVTRPPPLSLVALAQWLVTHRLTRLSGLVGVAGLAGVIGVVEGSLRRSRDVLGGFRLTAWTCGVLLAALLPGLGGAVLLVPWVLPWGWVASGLAGVVGMAGFGVGWGRPFVA